MTEWDATRWTTNDENSGKVFIDKIQNKNGVSFAVRDIFGMCLNDGYKFEFEPMPSNRDEKFFKRCRFSSLESAQSAYERSKAS